MELRFFKALWGMPPSLPDTLRKIEDAGWDGVSASLTEVTKARTLGSTLPFVAIGFPVTVEGFVEDLAAAESLGVEVLNLHAGKDWWPDAKADAFLAEVVPMAVASRVEVLFETHRGRLFHEPKASLRLLNRFPEIRLTADLSHWTCVCESMLADQPEVLELALSRTGMIHARVGHEEGPQVPDPRADRWSGHVATFEGWWSRAISHAVARGETSMRIDPEYGPPPYLWTDPSDERPLADLLTVREWARERLRALPTIAE